LKQINLTATESSFTIGCWLWSQGLISRATPKSFSQHHACKHSTGGKTLYPCSKNWNFLFCFFPSLISIHHHRLAPTLYLAHQDEFCHKIGCGKNAVFKNYRSPPV